jgi:alkaline phosphatase D
MHSPSRRRILGLTAAAAGVGLAPAVWTRRAAAQARGGEFPFKLGVASGEPLPDGVVLWTRLSTDPTALAGLGAGVFDVAWEIAEDDGFRRVVGKGEAKAREDDGHAVHVEVSGLKPGREYWYRFNAGGHASPVGRTRTAPEHGAAVDRLRIAYGSCQKWEAGYYAAHRHLAADNPDLVLFLGDYIYEGPLGSEAVVRPHPTIPANDLASYRQRYAWYRQDADLQAAHAAAPWLVMWDDHEVSNDYGNDADRSTATPEAFLRRRAAAYRAYWENMPLRRDAHPDGPKMRLYRSLDWGRLARLAIVDDRQHRDARTCRTIEKGKRIPYDCPERLDPRRSILGEDQEKWLARQVADSKAQWNLLGQQTLMGELRLQAGQVSNDGWDGYPATRRRILETWRDAKVPNPIALGGDVHCFFAGDLALEPRQPPIATEFVGGSISSLGESNANLAAARFVNPHLKYAEGEIRGYGRVDLTPKGGTVTFRGVANALDQGSEVRDLAVFALEDGRPGVKRA